MNKSKIVLSLIGLGALVVPVVLLIVFTGDNPGEPKDTSGQRQINQNNVQDVVNKAPPPPKAIPLPTSPSASPSADTQPEGSPSAQ